MTDFNLRQLVRETLAKSDQDDPKVVAEEVLAAIPPKARVDALRQALREYVRIVSNGERTAAYARAIRLAMKALLRDLWAEAKRIHEVSS